MIETKKFVPSLFTILNAFCGFMSIVNSSNGMYEQACAFIVYAAIFDVLDGMVARILRTSSDFGVELDSLSDAISFGAAPSFLLYSLHFKDYNGYGMVVSSMIMVFAAIRLARFNITLVGYEKDKFSGLPTPAAAITLISYVYFYHNKVFKPDLSNIFINIITIGLSLLMVSRFKYPAFPKLSSSSVRKNPFPFILIIIAAIVSLATKGYAIFFICLLFIFGGIVWSIISQFTRRRKRDEQILARKTKNGKRKSTSS
jgi:CDP-diacylglycerol---serine O-phosphatidyltransferase